MKFSKRTCPQLVVVGLVVSAAIGCSGEAAGATIGAAAPAAGVAAVPAVAAADPVLGLILNGLLDRVSTLIREAETAGQSLMLRAGSEAYMVISNAQAAYNDSLQKTVTALDAVATHNIQQLQTMVDALERRTAADTQQALQTAQTITNILPIANHAPQVSGFSPRFVANAAAGGPVVVTVKGNFFYASEADYTPVLHVGSSNISPLEITTNKIRFSVPADLAANALANKITTAVVTLDVPFKSGSVNSRAVASFRLLLGVLPPTTGKAALTCTTTSTVTDREHRSSQSWQQHSSNDDLDSTNCGPDYPGWRIVDDSVRFVVDWSQGNENDQWSKQQRRVNPSVCYFVHTVHHRFGTSGKINWHYEYDITRDRQVSTTSTSQVALAWGDSKSFTCPANAWKVTFDAFPGQHSEFTGPSVERWIKILVQGGGVVVKAPDLLEIDW